MTVSDIMAEHITKQLSDFKANTGVDDHRCVAVQEATYYAQCLKLVGTPGIIPALRLVILDIRRIKGVSDALVLPSEVTRRLESLSGNDVDGFANLLDLFIHTLGGHSDR